MPGRDQNIDYDLSLRDLFTPKMMNAIKATQKMDRAMGGLSNKSKGGLGFGGLTKGVIAGNLLTQGINRAKDALFDFEKGSIEAFGRQEQFLIATKTMFGGNADEAEALNNQLVQFAKTTPFQLTEAREATKMMIAYGSNSSTVVKELEILGNVASGVGAPMKDVAYLYGTLRVQGRAYSRDLMQFANRGIPIYEELGKVMGVNKDQIKKMTEQGKVGFKEVEKAFENMQGKGGKFFDLMKEQSKSLNGQISNMGDGWEQLQANIGEAQSGILKSTVEWTSGMLDAINLQFEAINRTQKLIKKGGGSADLGFSAMDFFGGSSRGGKDITASIGLQFAKAVDAAAKTPEGTAKQQKKFDEQLQYLKTQAQTGKISAENFATLGQIIVGSKKELTSLAGIRDKNAKLMAEESSGVGKKGKGVGSAGLGTTTEVSSKRPQNLIININDGLIKEQNINTTNLSSTTSAIRKEVAKALLETLNDANSMAQAG